MSDLFLRAVLSMYHLGDSSKLTLLNEGTANLNYLVQDGKQRYILRVRNEKYSSKNWLQYEEQYVHHLFAKGLLVAVPIINIDGQSWTVSEGKTYQLLPYLNGQKFTNNISNICSAGEFLGVLHNSVHDFVPIASKVLPRYDDPALALQIVSDVEECHRETTNVNEKDTLQFIKKKCKEVLKYIPDDIYNKIPKLVIHGDYHPANVKYTNESVSSLFDFDWISLQPRLRDIVDGIAFFGGIRSSSLNGGDIYSLNQNFLFDHDRSVAFVQAYCKTCRLPLLSDEVDLIPYLIAARLIFSRVQALVKIPEDHHIQMLTHGIEHSLRWLESHHDSFIASVHQIM